MADPSLKERINALCDASERAVDALPEIERLDPSLDGRLNSRLAGLLEASRYRLAGIDPDHPDVAAAVESAQELLDEVLNFVYGAAARRVRLDGGLCQLAEAWLDDLSDRADLRRVGVVIPSDTEFMVTLAQVVRLRFVHDGIYGLPAAAHEYGHFVAGELVSKNSKDGLPNWTFPVSEALRHASLEADRPSLWSLGHEVFADSFATYVCGPAYVNMCLRLRFHPAVAELTVARTHPPPTTRARIILATLERMAADEPAGGFLPMVVGNLQSFWVNASGITPEPEQPELNDLAKACWNILDTNRHTRQLRYRTYPRAYNLADRLLEAEDPLREDDTIADVLNAAWRRRLNEDSRRTTREVARRAHELCTRLAKS
jgi:hypothetical protein